MAGGVYSGVYLYGTYVTYSPALITHSGIFENGLLDVPGGEITNYGYIFEGTLSGAAFFYGGGDFTNMSSGLVSGTGYGVVIEAGLGNVVNDATPRASEVAVGFFAGATFANYGKI